VSEIAIYKYEAGDKNPKSEQFNKHRNYWNRL